MPDFVLGLDLGPNSIGWALLTAEFSTQAGHESYSVTGFLDTQSAGHPPVGVRVFEAGLQNFGTAKESSLCQQRRTARAMRRNHARRNARRYALRRLLTRGGLLPTEQAELDRVLSANPYALRAHGLDSALSPHELGRAIYHLGQRRGFKSNRKSGQSSEEKGMLKEIGDLRSAISASEARTLGEYLYHLSKNQVDGRCPLTRGTLRLRNTHTRREMYVQEFDQLIAAQRAYHTEVLTDGFVEDLRRTIFFQHPFEVTEERRRSASSRANLHRSPQAKRCLLIPELRRGSRAAWCAQQFRILKEVNNLRVSEHFSTVERPLTAKERELILARLYISQKVTFDQLRKIVAKVGTDPYAVFNLERGARNHLDGNSVESKLRACFGTSTWDSLADAIRDELRDSLLNTEDLEGFKNECVRHGASPDKAGKLAEWCPSDGYLAYSHTAIRRLIPHLMNGKGEDEAIRLEFPESAEPEALAVLPSLVDPLLPDNLREITNPIVRRALGELRKVVNAIISAHGRPRKIVIELAREMKDGPKGRAEKSKRNAAQRKRREAARTRAEQLGGNPNSRKDVDRILLWEDQGGVCLYSGRPIPQSELFGGEWEVDHILPRWRSLDDSYMNKALVHRTENSAKGDRLPGEWLSPDSEQHRQLLQRARTAFAGKNLDPKLARLGQSELAANEFAARQLNDTRYITRAVCAYLELLYPAELRQGESAVQSTRGGLTAELRRKWGLNDILAPLLDKHGELVLSGQQDEDGQPRKSRADHRHHAIDAIVVAASSRSMLKRYQDFWKAREAHGDFIAFPRPWEDFRFDCKEVLDQILVSHRPARRVRGALHEATFYGQARDRSGELAGQGVTRKPVADLKPAMIDRIRDDIVRERIQERLRERGWREGDKTLPKDWHNPEITTLSGIPIRRVRVGSAMKAGLPLRKGRVTLGNNHHLAILRDPDGNTKVEVIPAFEAIQRARKNCGNPVLRKREDNLELICSLSRKESVLVQCAGDESPRLAVVQMMSGQPKPGSRLDLYLRDARDARPASEGNKSPLVRIQSIGALTSLHLKKVTIDPLGRVRPAGD